MSDLAPIVTRIPVPGRSLWWLAGVAAAGLIVPTMIGAVTGLLDYYPIGAVLPGGLGFRLTGTLAAIGGIAVLAVLTGIAYAFLAWSWRPFVLSTIMFGAMIFGFYPGVAAHFYLRNEAFGLLAARSADLVHAIAAYNRATGAPPPALAALVPQYLSEIPGTGMSAYPDYEYGTGAGMCPNGNAWNVNVLVGDLLNFDTFFYCPNQDYPPDVGGNWVEVIGDWAYLHE